VSRTRPLIAISTFKTTTARPPDLAVVALAPAYSNGVAAAGGAPLQIPHGLDQAALRTIFERVDGVLLSGGGDVDPACYGEQSHPKTSEIDRERDELEFRLARWAIREGKPLFAICRGHQVLNVALGGSLYQDVMDDMPGAIRHAYFQSAGFARDLRPHTVALAPDSRVAAIMDGTDFPVNSLHHQGIKQLAPDLTAAGHAPDGLIEAVEVHGHPFAVGVQWHPESLAPADPAMQRLFDAFVQAARDGQYRR